MQRVESEVARLRIQVGSTEHSHAALEATVQGQLDACVRHVEKRLFKAAQAKVKQRQATRKPCFERTTFFFFDHIQLLSKHTSIKPST
jgi:hypothetical protein